MELDQEVSKKDETQGSTHVIAFQIVSLGPDALANNLLNLQLQTLWPLTMVWPSGPANGSNKKFLSRVCDIGVKSSGNVLAHRCQKPTSGMQHSFNI